MITPMQNYTPKLSHNARLLYIILTSKLSYDNLILKEKRFT